MEKMKKCLLVLLFFYLVDALKTNKQNQTTAIVNPKIDKFIEDDMEISNLNNNHEHVDEDLTKEPLLKENSTVRNSLKKQNKSTPKNSVEKSTTQAIYLPIDLLLKHPKINDSKTTSSLKNRRITTNTNPIVNYINPKIDFREDIIETVDESIADFYSAIKTNKETNKTSENHEDIKVVDEYVNINMINENPDVAHIDPRKAISNSNSDFKINPSPNVVTKMNKTKTPTATIEISVKSTPNDATRLNSSIVIHNTTYQEITQQIFCPSPDRYTPQWPYRSWCTAYPYNFYKYPYTRCNGRYNIYNKQYSMPYAPNIVRKTWNNVDVSMTNENYIKMDCEELNTPEYDENIYEVQDQNVI